MGCLNIIVISTFILSITNVIHAIAIKETPIYVEAGKNFNCCCSLAQKSGEALTISFNGLRIASLLRTNDQYMQIDANGQNFALTNPGYSMDSTSKSADRLCVSKTTPGAAVSDDKKKFRCELVAQGGLGKVLQQEDLIINVYELPQISTIPEAVEVTEGSSVNLECSATGRPGLKIVWKKAKSGEVLASFVANKTASAEADGSGGLDLRLSLPNVRREQDGEVLVCEATTSYPPKQTSAKRKTTLSVNYPPRMEIRNATVHTDLGEAEDIEIVVYGKPEPLLNCDLMNIEAPREVVLVEGGPNKRIYYIRLHQVKPEDIGEYRCSATNKLGTDYKTVQVTLTPSAPFVTSANFTSHADYYLLGWKAHSKSPLHNVTLTIESRKDGKVDGTQTGAAQRAGRREVEGKKVERKKMTFQLNATEPSAFGAQEYWHHLPNLTMDAEHRVYMWVCNKHACSGEPERLDGEPASDGKPHIVFKTPPYNGSNKVDPAVLSKPPSAAQLTAPEPSDVTSSAASFYALPFLVVSHFLLTL